MCQVAGAAIRWLGETPELRPRPGLDSFGAMSPRDREERDARPRSSGSVSAGWRKQSRNDGANFTVREKL